MSWATVDTKIGKHPKMAALPNDSARYGWLLTLLEAKEQKTQGTFSSTNHYRLVMGRYGRFVESYMKVGLLDKDEDGALHIHDWDQYQWAAAKARQRETSKGQSQDIDETLEGQKEDLTRASRAVSVPVLESTEGVQGEPSGIDAFYHRTGEVPGPKMRDWLNELADTHGESRLAAAIGETPMTGTNTSAYVRSIRDRLRLEDAAAERQERQAEQRRVKENHAPLKALPRAEDISEEEARRLAEEYTAAARAQR